MPALLHRDRYRIARHACGADRQGHGGAGRDALRGLLDSLGVAQVHLCGFSMGGSVALNFGLAYPARARSLETPVLIIVGDEDDPCLEPWFFMKRSIPRSGLAVFPQCGHTLNLEEPELFHRTVRAFLKAAEAGAWVRRDSGVAGAALAT